MNLLCVILAQIQEQTRRLEDSDRVSGVVHNFAEQLLCVKSLLKIPRSYLIPKDFDSKDCQHLGQCKFVVDKFANLPVSTLTSGIGRLKSMTEAGHRPSSMGLATVIVSVIARHARRLPSTPW